MIAMITKLKRHLRQFGKDEQGTATLEFVLAFPLIMTIFLASYEASFTMLKGVFLERSTDIAVRQLRLGNPNLTNAEDLEGFICSQLSIVADCDESIEVALQSVDTATWSPRPTNIPCRQRNEEIVPLLQPTFDSGASNELMFVRVCVKIKPFFGNATAFGLGEIRPAGADFNIIATTAFVNEPRT
ncbi:TadE/TadG family type IV pilus assembly protein [Pseudaestuariivita rosea]|uniref:TadE/TadG family type IV pilus assembly protein n=1 Tax=Pseudaestuariivita rosea TaxID=2763263 RepID=UPI001ABBA745|nr:pilus assembly protein [Pseudaestuariivita rosea]